MDDKEMRVERCRIDVSDAESKLREAKSDLDFGYKKLVADVARAEAELARIVAERDREYSRLKEAVKREENNVEREKAYLRNALAEKERGFEA